MGLQSKGLESEFDLLSFGDLQVPGLVQVVRVNIGIVWRLDHSCCLHGLPGCPESIAVYRVVTVEDDPHRVACADDGTWLVGATVFLLHGPVRDENVVISAGGMGLQSKALEGEHDPLSCGDLQVP